MLLTANAYLVGRSSSKVISMVMLLTRVRMEGGKEGRRDGGKEGRVRENG
jgi:hypothetical protein